MAKLGLNAVPARVVILTACGFARTVEYLLTDQRSRDAIDLAERFADGLATEEELEAAAKAAAKAATEVSASYVTKAAKSAADTAKAAASAADTRKAAATALTAARAAYAATMAVAKAALTDLTAASIVAVEVIESVFDCTIPPRIQVSVPIHIKGLATTIYDKRDWALMPILADALEEIGQGEMAVHCRCPIHTKGCHVLDSILADRFH